MDCLRRCFYCYDEEGEPEQYVTQKEGGGVEIVPLALPQPAKGQGCVGHTWTWLSESNTVCNLAARAVIGVINATALVVTTIFAVQQFQQDEQYHNRAMLFGTGFGIPITILTGCFLPLKYAKAFANWLSRWSYEGLQILTAFYLNAGCPINGNGFWDPDHVPLAVKELAMMIFTGVSVGIALLSLRVLLFPAKKEANSTIQINEIPNNEDVYDQNPLPIPMLESGKNNRKWFASEQLLKSTLGVTLIVLAKMNIVTLPEALYLGYYLTSHVGGVLLGTAFPYIKEKVLERCPVRAGSIDKIEKLANIIKAGSLAFSFALPYRGAFIPLGLISGVSKGVALHNFQLLKKNDETVTPFEWKRVDNIAKGALAALILAWYISGMTDTGLRPEDYANIIAYLSSIGISYPMTRYLAERFDPGNNSRLFNTLRFYFVNNSEVLVLPYMLIRSAQSIGDDQKDLAWFTIAQDLIAWISLGLASGNNRALMGLHEERTPNEVPFLAQLTLWFILASRGKFR